MVCMMIILQFVGNPYHTFFWNKPFPPFPNSSFVPHSRTQSLPPTQRPSLSVAHTLPCPPTHSLTHSPTHPPTHSLTRSLSHPPTHSHASSLDLTHIDSVTVYIDLPVMVSLISLSYHDWLSMSWTLAHWHVALCCLTQFLSYLSPGHVF